MSLSISGISTALVVQTVARECGTENNACGSDTVVLVLDTLMGEDKNNESNLE